MTRQFGLVVRSIILRKGLGQDDICWPRACQRSLRLPVERYASEKLKQTGKQARPSERGEGEKAWDST